MKLCPKCQKQFSDDANFCPVDAARLVPLEGQTASGDSLTAKYELGDKLGGTRTGTVVRGTDKQSRAAVAVKTVSPSVVALPGVAQRLERELKQLERVQSAGVAKVLASGKRQVNGADETWIALELLDGAQTLAEAITARGPIPLAEAAHLIEVIGEALIEAAQVGVVHRDLAPKNILFAGQDIKLINFSLPVPTTDKVPGVPEFVAPEQVEGKPVDQRSNLYSLGALYYFVLTGQTVHAGSPEEVHRAHTNGSIRTPSSLAAVPAQVEAVIMRALDRSPTKRFLTVRQFVDEVGRVARGEADPRAVSATQALGKAGRPKAELVQTLLGVRGGGGAAAVIAAAAAPQVASGKAAPLVNATVAGVPTAVSAQVAPSTTPGLPPPERSPWASPATVPPATAAPNAPTVQTQPGAFANAQTAVTAAAPEVAKIQPAPLQPAPPVVPAAPVVAAPVVAAPKVPQAPVAAKAAAAPAAAGKKKGGDGETKGKFRETMWFKKGELDAQAAEAAAEEAERTGKAGTDRADSLPMDERYKDDGTISRSDKEKYSLRTGGTQMMAQVREQDPLGTSGKVSEDALIDEMKKGRTLIFALIGIGVAALIVIIALLARG